VAGTQRIAFFSLKGGVGKTTLVTEAAVQLARRGRYRSVAGGREEPLRVALVDLDMASANVSMKVGLIHPTIWDLMIDPDPGVEQIDRCLVEHRESGLSVLLGPPRAVSGEEGRAMAVRRVAEVFSRLEDLGYHFVLIDLGSEIDALSTYVFEAAHQVYCVLTPTASAVQDTYRAVETLRRLGHRRKLRFVLNQAHGAAFDSAEMMADLGGTIAATVPRDEAFVSAENEHRPVSLGDRGAGAKGIRQLAAALYPALGEGSPKRGVWRRLVRRFG
jgi:pilus assembly protein CpaE